MGKSKNSMLDTRPKLLISAVLSLLLSYIFASLAIDTAYYWQYLLAIIFLVMGLKFLIRTFKSNGNK